MSEETTDTRAAAERYMRAGLAVIPVPAGEKNPNRGGWQNERWGIEDVPELWDDGQGIGVLWGEPSGGRVDVDLDWPQARSVARSILPATRTFGRPSATESHRVYRAKGQVPKSKKYKLPGDGPDRCVVEVLSTGAQSLVPPSLHHSGERRVWHQDRSAAEIESKALMEGAADVATAALIARNWPGVGARHDYTLAATGYVGRNLPRERAQRVMEAAIAASGDEEARGRLGDVRSTLDNLATGNPTTGGTTLETLAPGIVDQLQRWHGWNSTRGREVSQKGHTGSEEQSVGIIKMLADAITSEDHFARDAGDKLYRYSDGCYRQYAERYIRRRVKQLLEAWGKADKWSSHKASEVAEYIRADAPELWERPPADEVNVANGILDLRCSEARLRPHDPGYLSPVQIPASYDPDAECPAWDKFVSEVFPEDAVELAFELAADLITPSRSAQKAVLLLGEGSNGKSTYLRALTAFLGSTNASGVSLHKLESDRFATARLMGKLANICPDLPSTHLTETSVFKAITGGDDLHAEYKYRESFEFNPYCRLVFSANHVPRSGDASHAFFRRWLVVPFDRTFEPDEQVPREELDARLSEPGELSGVLNRALAVLPRIQREGFTESESMRDAWEEFKAMTDPVAVWLENNTVSEANAWVPKSALIAAYNKSAEESGRAGLTAQAFGRAMKRARPEVGEAQRTVGGRQVKCYTGVGLKGGDDPGGGGYDADAPAGGGGATATTATTDTTDSSIVTYPGTSSKTPHKDHTNRGGGSEETNKGNGSIGSNGSDGAPTYTTVDEFFGTPPSWLPDQLKIYRENPKRHIGPLCAAVAAEVLGDGLRGDEVREEVERILEENTQS